MIDTTTSTNAPLVGAQSRKSYAALKITSQAVSGNVSVVAADNTRFECGPFTEIIIAFDGDAAAVEFAEALHDAAAALFQQIETNCKTVIGDAEC
jgi:hypothetical protein